MATGSFGASEERSHCAAPMEGAPGRRANPRTRGLRWCDITYEPRRIRWRQEFDKQLRLAEEKGRAGAPEGWRLAPLIGGSGQPKGRTALSLM